MLGRFTDSWCLCGETLAYFVANYTLKGCPSITILARGDFDNLADNVYRFHANLIESTKSRVSIGLYGATVVIDRSEKLFEVISEFPRDFDRMQVNVPQEMGKALDYWSPDWEEIVERRPPAPRKNCFFDDERVKNACELIQKCLECGERAGIDDKMFLGFGGMLGYALRRSFLPNDDDIDLCIQGDDVSQEQLHQYLMECKSEGLTENRMRGPETIGGKYCWFSIGNKSIEIEHGVKCCNWVWFKHGGYNWHSKGKQWIGRHGLSKDYVTAKGIPANLSSELKSVKFCNCIDVNVLQNVGKCLDWWYPGWIKRKQESSKISAVLILPDEIDRKTWYIQR